MDHKIIYTQNNTQIQMKNYMVRLWFLVRDKKVVFIPVVSQNDMANVVLSGFLLPFFQKLGDPWISGIQLSYDDHKLAQPVNRIVTSPVVHSHREGLM